MKNLALSVLPGSLMVMGLPESSQAQQDGSGSSSESQGKSSAKTSESKPREEHKTRCRTPVCFRDNPGGYFTGKPKPNY